MVLREVNPKGRVITIDIEDRLAAARENSVFKHHVDFLLGSSTAPAIVQEVHRRVAGKKVLVLLDSNHSTAHVLDELRAYAPLIPVGGYLIVQDSVFSGHPVQCCGPGPWEAIDQFLAQNPNFEPDRERERLLHTYCPRGYLRRTK
jgi:cephalosporin hydroxylase